MSNRVKPTNDECQMTNLASIDIGSHTARLLISRKIGAPVLFNPLIRRRTYIRMAEGFEDQGKKTINPAAIDRVLNSLKDFASATRKYNVDNTYAISTGVMRRAVNRDHLLNLIYEHTGFKVKVVSGDEEARLTGKGVLHSLNIQGEPFVIFDLGGGSTEFIFGRNDVADVTSIPLGAMILTQRFLTSDPPDKDSIEALSRYVDKALKKVFSGKTYIKNDHLLVGTGGTVTTLAAMIYGIDPKVISPSGMNGLILKRALIEELFSRMKTQAINERLKLTGLDRGRADVIIAGSIVVIRILHFFKSLQMTVSLSDLLEGILIENLAPLHPTTR